MSPIVETVPKAESPEYPPDELLIETDGEPLESEWHRHEMNLLIELVEQHLAGRNDFFAGGNMFIYFSAEQVRNKDYRGPDFFFVWGALSKPLRPYWAVWKEAGLFPNVIVELLSPTTATLDRTTKKDIYEKRFKTPEYYCYDPDTNQLEGWRLEADVYRPIEPNERGWLWCDELGLWLGQWDGQHFYRGATWLRFYTPQGALVPTTVEAERQRVDAERQRADAERQRAEAERQRAEAAEAELAQLKAQLASLRQQDQP